MAEATTTRAARHQVRNNSNQSTFISKILLLITLILRIVVWPLRRIADFLFPPKEYDGVTNTADQAARAFVSHFEKKYLLNTSNPITNTISENVPNYFNGNVENIDTNNTIQQNQNPFQPTGYAKTLVESYRQQKLMLVYLHSPLHPEAEPFCQRILSHPQVLELLNQNILAWGGSIHTADGAHVAEMLNVSAYPYVALLACGGTGGSRVDMLWKMEGNSGMDTALDSFLRGVTTVLRGFQAILAEAEMRRLRREEEVRLRQEQDREFQETLLADQQRENERIAKLKAEEEESQAQQRAEELKIQQKENQITESRNLLTDEPPPKTLGTARLRITLPSGKKIDRRFYATEQIKHVMAYVRIWMHENSVPIENFELSSNYPKKTFTDGETSLQEGGLCPMAVLMVQDLDS